jgi:hypothetical protein
VAGVARGETSQKRAISSELCSYITIREDGDKSFGAPQSSPAVVFFLPCQSLEVCRSLAVQITSSKKHAEGAKSRARAPGGEAGAYGDRTMRFTKPIAAALALTIGAVSLIGSAEARHRRHHGDAFAAGVLGFAAGALLTGALAQPRYYYEPAPVYVAPPPPPPPIVYEPAPVYYANPEPWTPEWYSYCSSRYRSFNPSTGYFLGYDGDYHFCY